MKTGGLFGQVFWKSLFFEHDIYLDWLKMLEVKAYLKKKKKATVHRHRHHSGIKTIEVSSTLRIPPEAIVPGGLENHRRGIQAPMHQTSGIQVAQAAQQLGLGHLAEANLPALLMPVQVW